MFKKFGIVMHEPSTWTAIIALLSLIGVHLQPDQASAIIQAGVGLGGLLGVFFKWDTVPTNADAPPNEVVETIENIVDVIEESRK